MDANPSIYLFMLARYTVKSKDISYVFGEGDYFI